ncbi:MULTISPECIES: hypothetical protein [unclassified Rhizobium]|uniref:hypothetical protein n=1 Tax=unclassified Rhizobium TaxID=2613769 RepID=UPI0037F2DCF3
MSDQIVPTSVRYYERLTYAGMAVIFMNQVVNWDKAGAKHFSEAPLAYVVVQVAFLCVQIFWVWLVVRRRLNWARWATLGAQFVMMFIIGCGFGMLVDRGHADGTVLELVFLILATSSYLLAACLLFTRDAIPWFVPQRVECSHADANTSNGSAHSF